MNSTKTLLSLSAAIAAGVLTMHAEESKPNILLLLADDMGYGELGCYGGEVISTPNLDRLAAEGVRFSDFHSGNSVSSPSRAVLMTGIPSGYNTIRGNKGYQLEDGKTRVALKKEDVTMAEMLRGGGYQTAFIGKWHLEDPCDLSTWAYSRGFDFAAQEQWGDNGCKDAYTEHVEYINGLQDSLVYKYQEWESKDEFRTQIALDYLDNRYQENQPLFMFMSYRAPHAHEWYIGNKDLYADRGWSETERMHAAKITLLDQQVGRLLDKFESMGILDNTLVIFTSDNGCQNEGHDYNFFESNGDLRGYKRDAFEGGHRVPCIAYWRGKILTGDVSDFLCSAQDIMPTVAEAAGIKAPKQVQGLSLLTLLKKGKEPKRDALYWEMRDSGLSRQSVRMGDWKAVRYGMNRSIMLFDLSTDIGETKDLAAERPDIMARITPLFENMREDNPLYPRQDENLFDRFVSTKERQQSSFDADWRFIREDNPGFRELDFDHSQWRQLDVPHDWSIEEDYYADSPSKGSSGYTHAGIGWYRKEFSVNQKQLDKKHIIQFDGVFMNSEVWVNGNFLGRRPYGYSTFQYDITEYLNTKVGAKNVIAVRVDNSIPMATRWYNGSGIYRHVHLITSNYTHFNYNNGVYITTPVADQQRAVVNVDYKIMANFLNKKQLDTFRKMRFKMNLEGQGEYLMIRSIVFDANGLEVQRKSDIKFIEPLSKYVELSQEVEVLNPNRWSGDNPYMYYLKSEIVRVSDDGIERDEEIIDDVITPFGIRKLVFDSNKGMLVNDKQVKLNGVCLHHDAASLGAAVPEKVWVYRLQKLREMGCNAIRTAHNPFAPEFYHICDTMGFYVMDEAFDEWNDGWLYNYSQSPRGKASGGYQHYFKQWAETDLTDMIERDRNHPSIVMYSIANEVPFVKDPTAYKTVRKLVNICHATDPTRPVTTGDCAGEITAENGVCEELDILGYNYIRRIHPDSTYAPLRQRFSDKLFVGSETDKKVEYFLAYRDTDYVLGQFIWTGIDYLGETRVQPQRGWQAALLDVALNPREDALLFKSCWSKKPVVEIAIAALKNAVVEPFKYKDGITYLATANTEADVEYTQSWNWVKGDTMSIKVYSNCDEVELRFNGKSLGRKENDLSKYYVAYNLIYNSGTLEARGYNDGKLVEKSIIKSSGEATKIEANVVHSTIAADSKDISIVEVYITDRYGAIDPNAENMVRVDVSGAGKFIGMDSGNLFFDGNFKDSERKSHQGRLLVYLQSNGEKGDINLKLSSEGLTSKEIVIKAK
ncbi:MAG: sulfatase-like hydrolase/transferase [Rikenellaceae bacterium]